MNNILDKKPKPWYNIVISVLINALLVAVVVLCAFVFTTGPVLVSGNSMQNTLKDGQTIATTRYSPAFLKRDDIVIALMKVSSSQNEIVAVKRVVALPGDKIAFVKDGSLVKLYFYNGSAWSEKTESYIAEPMTVTAFSSCTYAKNYLFDSVEDITSCIILGENEYFLMGDNRNISSDSRFCGPVKKEKISAKMLFVVESNSFVEFIFNIIYPSQKGDI